MKTVDRQRDRHRKEPWAPYHRPEEELPVVEPFLTDDAEYHHRLKKGAK